jgi:hypothetical protein
MIRVMTTAGTRSDPSSTSDVETARSGSEPAAPSDAEKAAARAAGHALAARLLRNAAARWLTGDEITRIGRQLARSIDQYERLHRQPPTWADALAGVDPVLLAPLQAVPDGWPNQPAYWRRELRQHLMTELRKTRWIVYNRTPRSLQPGDQGRGWLRTGGRTAVVHPPHDQGGLGTV